MSISSGQTLPPHAAGQTRELTRSGAKGGKSEDGQALVEFTLILPIVLIILFGIVYFGLTLNGWIDETQLTSEGTRYAEVNQTCIGEATVWSSTTTYAESATVQETEGRVYTSTKAANTDHKPSTSPEWWRRASPKTCEGAPESSRVVNGACIEKAPLWSSATTYAIGEPVRTEGATEGPTYISIKAANTNHKPSTSPEWWTPKTCFLKWITEQGDNGPVKDATATMCSSTSKLGEPVEIELTYTHQWLPILDLGATQSPVTSTATMRIEAAPASGTYPTEC
jgi:Flp pilus assembly protein TadG